MRQPTTGVAQEADVLVRDRHAINMVERHDQEADGTDRRHGAGWQHGALHALLAAVAHECTDILEAAKIRLVNARLRTDGQRVTDLRNNDADLSGGDLHQRMTRDRVQGPQLEPQSRRQQPA